MDDGGDVVAEEARALKERFKQRPGDEPEDGAGHCTGLLAKTEEIGKPGGDQRDDEECRGKGERQLPEIPVEAHGATEERGREREEDPSRPRLVILAIAISRRSV